MAGRQRAVHRDRPREGAAAVHRAGEQQAVARGERAIDREVARQGQRAGGGQRAAAGVEDERLVETRGRTQGERATIEGDRAGAELVAAGGRDRAGADDGAATVGVVAGERERAGALLGEAAGAADDTGEGEVIGAVHHEGAAVGDVAADRACGAAVAKLECAAVDGGAAGVGVVGGEDERAGAGLGEAAGAADDAGIGHGVGAIEDQRGVVGHIARKDAGAAAVADLQGAAGDGGAAAEAIGPGEDHRAVALFSQTAPALKGTGIGGVGAVAAHGQGVAAGY